MALTAAQKASVRLYLGWSGRYVQTDDNLERAMSSLAGSPEDEAIVIAHIAKCDAISTEIETYVRKMAKATQAGDIQLRAAYQLGVLRSEGRQYAARISNLLGVPIRGGGGFGTGGAAGLAGVSGPSGGGNYLPQG